MKPTLVVMAAGMGSRYGGLKQIDPVGPNGEIIIDYSVYDAIKSDFGKVVFVIKREIEKDFREKVGKNIERKIETEYVFQDETPVPVSLEIPKERVKPWGTAHAVYACRNNVDTPFAIINADDFYGRHSFMMLSDYLKNVNTIDEKFNYCMVGFKLSNTLTENGYVSRGVCKLDTFGYLQSIVEYLHIEKDNDGAKYSIDNGINFNPIDTNTIVSMNAWGVTPSIFGEIENQFTNFVTINKDNLMKAEFYLPTVVDTLINQNLAKVKVLPCQERWYGVTYKEDKKVVEDAIAMFIKENKYPKNI